MTIAEFLLRYEQEGTRCMKDVYEKCCKICIGTLLKCRTVPEQAEAIFVESLIALFENAEKGRIKPGSAKLSTYVTQICLNKLKQGIREQSLVESIAELPDMPEEKIDDMEAKLIQLEKCIGYLPDKSQQLVKMWMEAMPHRAIAEILGYANEHVSKAMFNEIKNTLRKCLGIGPKS